MMEWLLDNVVTLFSGLGTFILGRYVFKHSRRNPKEKIASPATPEPAAPVVLSEHEKMAGRLSTVVGLIAGDPARPRFPLPQLSRILGFTRISDLEIRMTGEVEASFEFLHHFCQTFGVHEPWLVEGRDAPFLSPAPFHYDPSGYLGEIRKLAPERIYFLRSDSGIGEFCMLLKLKDWHYRLLPKTWHLSSVVGNGGTRQLNSFYELVNTLRAECDWYLRCFGRTLEHDEFQKLLAGEVFPGTVADTHGDNPWWDDFTDIYHEYPIAEHYGYWYGQPFTDAQGIIKAFRESRTC